MSTQQTEDPIKCDRCNANTYRSHQEYPDTWQYDYMAYCKDCQKEMTKQTKEQEENDDYVCECGETVKDEMRCDDCGLCQDPSKPSRCCECEDSEEPPHKDES
tara:strand:+ start:3957 stop:4265 length:309 start_codon:yes stop_codon:yes gene_type:complete